MDKSKKVIKVSDDFIEIYKNFNVIIQTEKMKALHPKELFLLLIAVLDSFSETDLVVKSNLIPFKSEMMQIFDLQDDNQSNNPYLIELCNETGDKYIDTDHIQDLSGKSLPKPYTKEEVRDIKIKIIQDK